MKRRELIRHLIREGCILFREGARHTVYLNPENGHTSTIPRHIEIDDNLARKISRQLDIPYPK